MWPETLKPCDDDDDDDDNKPTSTNSLYPFDVHSMYSVQFIIIIIIIIIHTSLPFAIW